MIAINTPSIQTYNGDDITSVFLIPFPVFEPEAVNVTLIDENDESAPLIFNLDYTLQKINVLGLQSSVTLLQGPLSAGNKLVVEFNRTAFQPVNLRVLGAFAPVEIEKALDRITMAARRTSDYVDETFEDLVQIKEDLAQAQQDITQLVEDFTELALEVAGLEGRIEDNEEAIADIKRTQYEINTISSAGTYLSQAGNLYVVRTSNAVVVQMPPTPEVGDVVHVKSRASTSNITVNGNGNNVDGSGTFSLSSEDSSASIIFDGTEWLII